MHYDWDDRAADELEAIGNLSRAHAIQAGEIFREMGNIASNPAERAWQHVDRGSWELGWWSTRSIRAYFGLSPSRMVVLHVCESSAGTALAEADRRLQEY